MVKVCTHCLQPDSLRKEKMNVAWTVYTHKVLMLVRKTNKKLVLVHVAFVHLMENNFWKNLRQLIRFRISVSIWALVFLSFSCYLGDCNQGTQHHEAVKEYGSLKWLKDTVKVRCKSHQLTFYLNLVNNILIIFCIEN